MTDRNDLAAELNHRQRIAQDASPKQLTDVWRLASGWGARWVENGQTLQQVVLEGHEAQSVQEATQKIKQKLGIDTADCMDFKPFAQDAGVGQTVKIELGIHAGKSGRVVRQNPSGTLVVKLDNGEEQVFDPSALEGGPRVKETYNPRKQGWF